LGAIMLVPHGAETGRAEDEKPARPRRETEPARGEHSKKVPAGEEQRVALHGPDPEHHSVGASADLVGRLPVRAAVAEQLPVRALGLNLGAGPPFVGAVAPLS